MRILVVYYSLTGNTKAVAERIATRCHADMEQIKDANHPVGTMALLQFAFRALFKRSWSIKPSEKDPAQYDLVVLGTPVWAWTMSSPIRAYIVRHSPRLHQVAFFCTEGGAGGARAFRHMVELIGRQPVATLEVTGTDLKSRDVDDKLNLFLGALAQRHDRAAAPEPAE